VLRGRHNRRIFMCAIDHGEHYAKGDVRRLLFTASPAASARECHRRSLGSSDQEAAVETVDPMDHVARTLRLRRLVTAYKKVAKNEGDKSAAVADTRWGLFGQQTLDLMTDSATPCAPSVEASRPNQTETPCSPRIPRWPRAMSTPHMLCTRPGLRALT